MYYGHGRMANVFLGNGSVQRRECILTKNDKQKTCRENHELFEYEKRGGKKGGQRSIEFGEWRVRPRKTGKSSIFYAGVSNQKGGAPKGAEKGGATFPNVCSDQI